MIECGHSSMCVFVRFRVCCIHVFVVRVCGYACLYVIVYACLRGAVCLRAFLRVGVSACLCVFLCVARGCV